MRPLGLYFLMPGDALFAGLLPMLGFLFIYTESPELLQFGQLAFHVLVTGFLMACAAGTFFGDEFCRKALLALITVHYASVVLINVVAAGDDVVETKDKVRAVSYVVQACFWCGVNWWYLNRKHTLRYFAG